ncbi:hypothetical protein SPI_06362 [Niveomyces insectorum RCEF 264]|uniref:Uncharacterized protein n=1 Tax=Niveomyces insectorum RCEF 264 TaxID=1081102 RepID=A0A167S251_9HYPO|nr:hypothetical protein SPI_06362 [Niveomyces insectorum RCEF 264]
MKPTVLLTALLAAPVLGAPAAEPAEVAARGKKAETYASYGDYPPPKGGYASYGDYPPPKGGYGSYGSYATPKGGYGTYGTYRRWVDSIKSLFA